MGVRPEIRAKQNARLICEGSVSEFNTFRSLAVSLSILYLLLRKI
jgi:hypothetical protein